jgi:cation transport ATPase
MRITPAASAVTLDVPCSQVTAGTVLFEAPITMRATATGAGSMLSGIGRLVAAAQARETPVQRLADTIAGRFCYTVIGASAATFAFWTLAGALRPLWARADCMPQTTSVLVSNLCRWQLQIAVGCEARMLCFSCACSTAPIQIFLNLHAV